MKVIHLETRQSKEARTTSLRNKCVTSITRSINPNPLIWVRNPHFRGILKTSKTLKKQRAKNKKKQWVKKLRKKVKKM